MRRHLSLPFRNMLLLALLTGEPALRAAAASGGTLKVNGATYTLKFGYAVPSPNALPSEKASGTYDSYLILVDTAIPDKTFAAPLWNSQLKRDPKIHGLYFVVDSQNKLIGGGLLAGSKVSLDGIWTSSDFVVAASDGQHVEGSGKSAERRLPNGTVLSFDVNLNAARWKPATAEASPQAQAYQVFLTAVKAGNAAEAEAQLSSEARKQMAASSAGLASRMKVLRQMLPKNPRYTKLTVDGNTASLDVEDGQENSGTVQFVLEAGQWKIRNIDWN